MSSNIWFTSDLHFSHRNILSFCPETRLGSTPQEMNEILIQKWNEQVKPDDTVYLLGDVFFCGYQEAMKIASQLNGNIHLVYGNHDKVIRKNQNLKDQFVTYQDYLKVVIDRQTVIMHHYPYLEWEQCHRGAMSLFGHVHGSMNHHAFVNCYRMMDVGIDSRPNGIEPEGGKMSLWSWEQIRLILSDRQILRHH